MPKAERVIGGGGAVHGMADLASLDAIERADLQALLESL
jgi:hypothetical protein